MPRSARIDQFVAELMANGTWTTEDRDRFFTLAENGASVMSLFNHLKDVGFEGGYYNVYNWHKSRDLGSVAAELNARYRQARGLHPSDALNQLSAWLLDTIGKLYEELAKREDLERVSTKDLLFLISNYGGKAQGAIAETGKVKVSHDDRELILGVMEEFRLAWRQVHEAENPELLGMVEPVIEMVRLKLDL